MNIQSQTWGTIHASVFRHGGLLRWTSARPRGRGAMRYRCPVTGSYVLVTDEPTLGALASPPGRVRCADCGEQHLVTVDADEIVAPSRKS